MTAKPELPPEPLTDSVSVLRTLEALIQNHRRDIGKLEVNINLRLAALKERLLAGETTGDPVCDYVIVAHGALDLEMEARYREIIMGLKGHLGEMVILEYWQTVPTGQMRATNIIPSRGHGDDEDQRTFLCGVLTSEELTFVINPAASGCRLPVSRWAGEAYPNGPLEYRTLLPDPFVLLYPNHEGLLTKLGHHRSITHIVIAGDDAVKKWFAENRREEPDLFHKCAEMLGKLVLTSESA